MEHKEQLNHRLITETFELKFDDGPESLRLRENSIDFGEHNPAVLLSSNERELVRWLISPLSEPRLAKTIKARSYIIDKSVRISDVFKSLQDKLESTPVSGHLISVGQGSGQSYGMLYENSDYEREIFAYNGIEEIDSSPKKMNKDKRKEPFEDLLFLIRNGVDNERHTTNRKKILAGSTAVSITIGTAATVYVLKHMKRKET
jgi:hypothetical protein